MYAMRLLLLFIALLSCGMPAAQTASLLRFFNPYSWLYASPNQTPIRHANTYPKELVTSSSANNSQLNASLLESDSMMQQSSRLPSTPLSVADVDADENVRGASYVQALVPTNVVPISGLGAPRLGLVKESEIPEGREDTELQTTTETIGSDPATTKEDPANERHSTTDGQLEVKALSSSTETRDPALTVSPATTTSHVEHDSPQEERGAETKASVHLSTAMPESTASEDTVTSATPVYVGKDERPFMTFLHADDFARYLNRNYYNKTEFDAVVGRQTE